MCLCRPLLTCNTLQNIYVQFAMLMIFCTMSNYYSFSLSVSLESMSVVSVSFLSIWKDTLFKIQNFPAAATIDPPGGLTAPPQTPPPVLLGFYMPSMPASLRPNHITKMNGNKCCCKIFLSYKNNCSPPPPTSNMLLRLWI